MKNLISLILCLFIVACGINYNKYYNIDEKEKTIVFPSGSGRGLAELKKAFIEDGWKIYANSNSRNITLSEDEDVDLGDAVVIESTLDAGAMDGVRYKLQMKTTKGTRDGAALLLGGAYYMYDLSVIDTKLGVEIFNAEGSVSIYGMTGQAEEIVKYLNEKI